MSVTTDVSRERSSALGILATVILLVTGFVYMAVAWRGVDPDACDWRRLEPAHLSTTEYVAERKRLRDDCDGFD